MDYVVDINQLAARCHDERWNAHAALTKKLN
jgi:hypothetical protein